MKIATLREKAAPAACILRTWDYAGVRFQPPSGRQKEWLHKACADRGQESLLAFLAQLEEEEFASLTDEFALHLSWDTVYRLADSEDHRAGFALLGLPPMQAWRPRLESRGGLGDQDFAILLAGWIAPSGEKLSAETRLQGAIITWKGQESLLNRDAWRTVGSIAVFHRRWMAERTGEANRRGWAAIRKHALAAKADLSNFLESTVVVTPDKLHLRLRRGDTGGKLVEVIPEFAEAPAEWIDIFDRGEQVLDRYDIPQGKGMLQILLSPEVRSVLKEIKAMPGRRVVGARAEAFLRNPFAALGPDATAVLDPVEFEAECERAAIIGARFTPEVVRDAQGMLCSVILHIQEGQAGAHIRLALPTLAALSDFVARLDEQILAEAQCCRWQAYELEILGATHDHLALLKGARKEWHQQEQFTLAELLDLSSYSGRIEGFGVARAQYSPFLAKAPGSSWFPDEVSYGVLWQPDDASAPIALRMCDAIISDLTARIAEEDNAGNISVPGLPAPLTVKDTQRILATFDAARQDVAAEAVPVGSLPPVTQPCVRRQLLLRANAGSVDYEERRGTLSMSEALPARMPARLKPDCPLKQHQVEGLRWLQHLFAHSPDNCRGALLADDMGLGKTLQLLAFLATCLETEPAADPFLIVAPVALLENWQAEIDKFFLPDTLSLLLLYGPALAARRVPRATIDAELGAAGVGKLLVRNWLGDARIVLTTYETLRDLEFSLARQRWSVMICDEAQKIKNPNSMVSRAARKQNARFRIACTGTPVENSLVDLWALFDLIQPGLLGALAEFCNLYRRPIETRTEEEASRLNQLRALIEPQKLRRTKEQAARDLPRKIVVESCRSLPLSHWQRSLYGETLRAFREPVGGGLTLLYALRSICTHPQSISGHAPDHVTVTEIEQNSPKMAWLLKELFRIRERREKVILFCESRELQRVLRRAISERLQLVPDIINGDTSTASGQANNRQRRIAAFQQGAGFGVIILSPLATGFGLNVQGANHVIHFTRSWNPAKEDQATDRAYRIGQTREVYVYYPAVTAPDFDTFDAKLDQLLERKRALSRDLLNGAGDILPGDFAEANRTTT